jgi:hypothetical protein
MSKSEGDETDESPPVANKNSLLYVEAPTAFRKSA